MNGQACIRLLILVVAVCVRSASAGTISVYTTVSTSVRNDTLRITIRVENRGTEAAYQGQAEIAVLGQKVMTDKVAEFPVGKPVVFTKEIKLDEKNPGSYPLLVNILYTDANQNPFSALASHVFPWQATNVVCDVVGKIDPVTISKRGKVVATLKNLGDEDITAATRLVVPRELTADGETVSVALAGRSERTVKFAVKNFFATGGSTYPVAVISEFDRDGMHCSAIATGPVKIVDRPELLGMNYYVLGGILAVLVLVFIVFEKLKK